MSSLLNKSCLGNANVPLELSGKKETPKSKLDLRRIGCWNRVVAAAMGGGGGDAGRKSSLLHSAAGRSERSFLDQFWRYIP
jgi:hypothetical protein